MPNFLKKLKNKILKLFSESKEIDNIGIMEEIPISSKKVQNIDKDKSTKKTLESFFPNKKNVFFL